MAKPITILAWHRKLSVQKFDGSQQWQSPGRSKIAPELEALIVRMAQENHSWRYDRIVSVLANLGYWRENSEAMGISSASIDALQIAIN